MTKKRITAICAALAACALLTSCGMSADDLMSGITPAKTDGRSSDDRFCTAETDFALALLRGETAAQPQQNVVLAPYSLSQTLAMSANGAKGDTLAETEQLFGGLTAAELNSYFSGNPVPAVKGSGARLLSANSIWFRDQASLDVKPAFLQTNADCYGADIFKAAFDDSTVADMNAWISESTGGAVKNAVQSLEPATALSLLNALSFESEWAEKYEEKSISPDGIFCTESGEQQTAVYMYSDEAVFLWSEDAVGFTKPYRELGGHVYEFCAVLPNEGISLGDYLRTVTAETFPQPAPDACTRAGLPKFGFSADRTLNDTLKGMGLSAAFSGDTADYTDMATTDDGNIYLSSVRQIVRVDVDDEGTKAEGITIQDHAVSSADPRPEGQQNVTLSRPFLFLIRDADTKLPLFAGAVYSLNENAAN